MRAKAWAAFLVLSLASCCVAEAQQLLERSLELRAGDLRCVALPDGRLQDLRFKDALIVKDVSLYGKDESDKRRMLQGEAPSVAKTTLSVEGDFRILKTEGSLARGQGEPTAARYVQTARIGPFSIEVECEVEILVQMKSRMQFLSTNIALPIESYAGRGFLLEKEGRAPSPWLVPLEYSEESKIHTFAKKAVFSQRGFVVEIASSETLSVGDERSWKGKSLCVSPQQDLGWSHTQVVYPPGRKFAWSWSLRAIPAVD